MKSKTKNLLLKAAFYLVVGLLLAGKAALVANVGLGLAILFLVAFAINGCRNLTLGSGSYSTSDSTHSATRKSRGLNMDFCIDARHIDPNIHDL